MNVIHVVRNNSQATFFNIKISPLLAYSRSQHKGFNRKNVTYEKRTQNGKGKKFEISFPGLQICVVLICPIPVVAQSTSTPPGEDEPLSDTICQARAALLRAIDNTTLQFRRLFRHDRVLKTNQSAPTNSDKYLVS